MTRKVLALPERPDADSSSNEDAKRVFEAKDLSISANTLDTYSRQWRKFTEWCERRGVEPLPSEPFNAATYLVERSSSSKKSTVRLSAAAIAFAHRRAGFESPTDNEVVKATLAGINWKDSTPRRQARGITADHLKRIERVARKPRLREKRKTARRRGDFDVALISLMRDCMLRRSEVADVRWEDLSELPDGSGRLFIAKSNGGQEFEGSTGYVSPETMLKLTAIRKYSRDGKIFPFNDRSVTRRIADAARYAGLKGFYSGHSPKIGMAQDLARTGSSLTQMMTAGRWTSASMPARYTMGEEAGRNAVAFWYDQRQ